LTRAKLPYGPYQKIPETLKVLFLHMPWAYEQLLTSYPQMLFFIAIVFVTFNFAKNSFTYGKILFVLMSIKWGVLRLLKLSSFATSFGFYYFSCFVVAWCLNVWSRFSYVCVFNHYW